MPRRETAYGQVDNVVVFVFPSKLEADQFIQQLKMADLMNRIKMRRKF